MGSRTTLLSDTHSDSLPNAPSQALREHCLQRRGPCTLVGREAAVWFLSSLRWGISGSLPGVEAWSCSSWWGNYPFSPPSLPHKALPTHTYTHTYTHTNVWPSLTLPHPPPIMTNRDGVGCSIHTLPSEAWSLLLRAPGIHCQSGTRLAPLSNPASSDALRYPHPTPLSPPPTFWIKPLRAVC